MAVLALLFWAAFLLFGRPRSLQAGLTVTREMMSGEVHRYRARLAAGDFLRVTVSQGGSLDGLDLSLVLRDPEGAEAALADDPNGGLWDEELAWVARSAGTYVLEVRRADGPTAAYRLQVKSLGRPARAEDTLRSQALRLDQQATLLMAKTVDLPAQIQLRRRSQVIWARLGDRRREAEAFTQIGAASFSLGEYETAVAHHRRAARLWSELARHEEQARALNELAKAQDKLGRRAEARRAFDQGLALAAAPATRMYLLHNRGRLHIDLGQVARGITDLRASLALARQLHDSREEANTLNELGYAYRSQGLWSEAIHHFRLALKAASASGDLETELSVHNSLGGYYKDLGEWGRASEHYTQALKLVRRLPKPGTQAAILNNLALVRHRDLQIQSALELFEEALALKQLDQDTEATALNNMAFVHLELGHPRQALALCDRAARLAPGNEETKAAILEAQAIAHLQLGEHESARRTLEKALALNGRRRDRFRQASLTVLQGKLARAEQDLDAALGYARQAVGLVESFRTGVEDETLRASFLASKRDPYDFYVDTLVALHRTRPGEGFDAESLRVHEMSRARSLLDLLNQAATQASRRTGPALPQRLQRLRLQVIQLRGELRAAEPAKAAGTSRRLAAAEEEYERTLAEIRRQNLGTAEAQYSPLTLAEIQAQVLGPDTLLLEYALGDKQSYLWAVTPASLHVFSLPPKREIEKTARSFYEQLRARTVDKVDEADVERADERAVQLAAELSRIILEPVESAGLLRSESKILVVSDGALHYIPFSALPLPSSLAAGRRKPVLMVEEHEIVHLPSASVLASLRQELSQRQPPARTLALFADPVFERGDSRFQQETSGHSRPTGILGQLLAPRRAGLRQGHDDQSYTRLHWSDAEADEILKLVDRSQVFEARGFDASVATVTRERLDQYRLLHFATHGNIDSSRPERSSLVLSLFNRDGERQDGYLRLTDVYNLRLNADLVVLSACETALGKEMRGEGLIGLTRGFMYAGSRRVLASLWSVDDRVTAELMRRLYQRMLKERKSPAAALRQAQIDMLRDEDWQSPYYWAGFSLQGEWR